MKRPHPALYRVRFMSRYLSVLLFSLSAAALCGQTHDTVPDAGPILKIDGEMLQYRVEDGDTLLLANLADVSVTSLRSFESEAEYRRYLKYRRYASSVYPYAVEAIRIFREVQEETDGLKKRKRKHHVRHLQKDLKDEVTDPLKDLSRTQGKILIKMIERKLQTPTYDLLKNLRGGMSAGKWQTLGKLYGYDLKEGYLYGQDPILDAVLQDFEIKDE